MRIYFHKAFHKFTKCLYIDLEVSDYLLLISGLTNQFPLLGQYIELSNNKQESAVFINKDKHIINKRDIQKNILFDELWLVPCLLGHGKAGGLTLGLILVGTVLLASSIFGGPAGAVGTTAATTGAAAAEAADTAFLGLTGISALAAKTVLGIGFNLILSSLIALIMPDTKRDTTSDENTRRNNDMYEGLTNTTTSQQVMALHYGRMRVGGQLVSGEIRTTSIIKDTTSDK
jgi:predicted phage tail protein